MTATADPPTDLELVALLCEEPCLSADEAARELVAPPARAHATPTLPTDPRGSPGIRKGDNSARF